MRCQLALFSAYRIDQYSDPESFKNSLGAVLEGFPDEVIKYVCDPRTGLQRRLKWPPTISEIVEVCEDHQEHLERLRKSTFKLIPKPYVKPSPNVGKVFVAQDHPGYSKIEFRCEPWTSPDGKKGLLVPAQYLIELGLMKRSYAND